MSSINFYLKYRGSEDKAGGACLAEPYFFRTKKSIGDF